MQNECIVKQEIIFSTYCTTFMILETFFWFSVYIIILYVWASLAVSMGLLLNNLLISKPQRYRLSLMSLGKNVFSSTYEKCKLLRLCQKRPNFFTSAKINYTTKEKIGWYIWLVTINSRFIPDEDISNRKLSF